MGLGLVEWHSYLIQHSTYCRLVELAIVGSLVVEILELLTDFAPIFSKLIIEFAKFSDFIFAAYLNLLLSRRY